MAMLDKRLKRMEERVIKIIPKEEAGKIANIARANVKPPSASQAPKSSGSKKRSADEAFFEELNEWTQSTSIYGTSQDRQPRKLDQNERQLLTEGAEHLPSEDLQEHLAEVFFDCLYGQSYHLLHKPSFMRRLRARTVPPVLILAVCAVAARFSTHPQVNTEPAFLRGESWAKPARDIALRRYDEPNITILTVYLILGLHEFGTCQGGRSWMLGGMAVRMAYALQLHRELDHDPLGRNQEKPSELSFTDREIRRRTMWACFLMDRFNSSGTERPMFANEENIEVQLPINESNFQMEISGPTEGLDGSVPNPVVPDVGQVSNPKENMGVAAYSIRVIALWGQLIKYFNLGGQAKDPHPIWHEDSQFTELKKQVNDFKSSLPSFLVYTMDNLQNHGAEKLGNQFLFLHICLNQVILFMHKFAIPAAPGGRIPKEMPKEFVAKAAPIAFEAAGQISNLLNESSEHLLTAPFTGYCAFLSSTVHVWAIFSKNPQFEDSSKQNLAYNVKYLSRMKKHWGMFHYMVENLKEIYRQYADAALRGPNASGSSLQDTSIFQYGDWYTKYPHGVSSTDYQDPDTDDKEEAGVDAVLSQKTDLQSVEAFFSNLLPTKQSRENARHARSQRKKDISHEAHSQLLQSLKADSQLQQHSQLMSQSPPMLTIPPQQQQQQAFDTSPYSQQDHLYTPSHTTPFPFNFNTPNLMAMAQHTPFLGDLDRQLVYGAYASNDSDPASSLLNNIAESSQGHPQNASAWDQALEYSHSIASQSGQGYADLGSTSAWLMPFNLNPPLPLDVGSDTDYTGLGGYGDSEQAGSSGV
ncbi:MAG: hypothetical protein MMC33_001455 [Icmadophila ericetorum]|nr:hypothetical protein [Icmadophila ericetorum]